MEKEEYRGKNSIKNNVEDESSDFTHDAKYSEYRNARIKRRYKMIEPGDYKQERSGSPLETSERKDVKSFTIDNSIAVHPL